MTETKKVKWQGSSQTRYGAAGPPVEDRSGIITVDELKELIEREKVRPDQIFSKQQILNDPEVRRYLDKLILKKQEEEKIKADKLKENDMIPGDDIPKLTPEQKRKQAEENEFIPNGKTDNKGENDLIPD